MNTKTMMAALGLALCAYNMFKSKKQSVPKNLVTLFVLAAIVSLAGVLSMTLNNTIDDAYSGYVTSAAVWLSAAYVVCCSIRWAHGEISIELVCNYLIAVCVMQCASALLIDNYPVVQDYFDLYVDANQKIVKEAERLYGFGASLDVAGMRFGSCLIMIVALMVKNRSRLSVSSFLLYELSFVFITVVGSMIARTTYVGVGLAALYVVISIDYSAVVTVRTFRMILLSLSLLILAVIVCSYLYETDPNFRHWLRFAFEGFFNWSERGTYAVASTETLRSMYVFPDNPKTWIIGDGYFSNPYWSDWTYTYIDQNLEGFYKGTDVGYLRFIFYFGILGLLAFILFMCNATKLCVQKCSEYKALFVFILIANFVIWFKVSTDLFLIMALFICTVNMRPEESGYDETGEFVRA